MTLATGCAPGVRASGQDPDTGRGAASETSRPADRALREALESDRQPAYVTSDDEGSRLFKLTRTFYEKRQFAPAWLDHGSPRPQMDGLIAAIHAADREGIDPELYNARLLDERRQAAPKGFLSKKRFADGEAVKMDMWLTYLYMKYASDIADGLSDLAHADPAWQIKPEPFDPLDHLEKALHDNRVAESLAELTPASSGYRDLRKALMQYRRVRRTGQLANGSRNHQVEAGTRERTRARDREAAGGLGRLLRYGARRWPACGIHPGSARGGETISTPARTHRRRDRGCCGRRRDERAARCPHSPDRAEPGTVAVASTEPRRALHSRQHPGDASRCVGSRHRAAHDARGRRQAGNADADFQ